MSVLSDKWIRKMSKEYNMISPFEEKQVRGNKISFGTSSAVQATEIGTTNLCNFEPMEPVVTISIK